MPSEHITFSTVGQRFAWNLRIARRRAGLTQRQLAQRMGRTQRRIAEWESGRRRPRIDSITQLAEALEIEPGELLRETKGLAS
jgi:HTH-type transcriptional regulator, cell division transcriptional repressor